MKQRLSVCNGNCGLFIMVYYASNTNAFLSLSNPSLSSVSVKLKISLTETVTQKGWFRERNRGGGKG